MTLKPTRLLLTALLACSVPGGHAERAPVLNQIEVPHDYYFREMYLPHATTGPMAPAWAPDGRSVVYSMQGSLWRQALDSTVAVQLTNGPGYDYQPDVSPDGEQVVFVRYHDDAMELQMLEMSTGAVTALTADGAVNTEPRFSPDGSRLAFISTGGGGRFRLFVGSLDGSTLNAAPLLEERESEVTRYYYGTYDHQLSPSWSPDGDAIMYVGNPEVPYGTGGVWVYPLDRDAGPELVRSEETTWRARPDWAPDGRRFVYASYLGRQWHQLWTAAVDGNAEPFPLSYGDYDIWAPRWSPDGQKIAYVANESGNTELRIQEVPGGKVMTLAVEERQYRVPAGRIEIASVDGNGRALPARVSVVAADGRSYAPHDAWLHADDGYDRELADYETHYFHTDGKSTITLPVGPARVTVWRGLENAIENRLVTVLAEQTASLTVAREPLDLPDGWEDGWLSGDVHVHMNYGGTYRNTPRNLVRQAAAEDLDLVFNLIVNKEQRIPDIAYFSTRPDDASTRGVALLHAQEFHTSYWGHMGLLGLDDHLLIPDYSAYPGTAAASLYPDNAAIADLAHEQDAVVGYVHPFLSPPDPENDASLSNAFPVDVALGKVDYYEVVGFADHRASAEVWYRLLNLGFRVAAAGGTDAMANYASLRGPVGANRVYVNTARRPREPADRRDIWLEGLKAGHTIATNGPLLGLTVEGRGPGEEIALPGGPHELEYSGFLRSVVPVDHLELVYNGEVIDTIRLSGERTTADVAGGVTVDGSGWLLLRAWNEASHPMIFDLYPYATTSPVYVTVGGEAPHSAKDAAYFIAWIERIRESAADHPDYNNDAERAAILAHLDAARRVFEHRVGPR